MTPVAANAGDDGPLTPWRLVIAPHRSRGTSSSCPICVNATAASLVFGEQSAMGSTSASGMAGFPCNDERGSAAAYA